jgi:hypothetical protein
MDLLHWLLLAVVAVLLPAQFSVRKKAGKVFDPETYSYGPSPSVLGGITKGDELESIRLIREETGLGLKEGRDLYRHLKAQQPLC